jgi:hypothetical protein
MEVGPVSNEVPKLPSLVEAVAKPKAILLPFTVID